MTVLNASGESWPAAALLDGQLASTFSDVEVQAAGKVYAAHSAVLSAHSRFFRRLFTAHPAESCAHSSTESSHLAQGTTAVDTAVAQEKQLPSEYVQLIKKKTVKVAVPGLSDDDLRIAWDVVYRYCYGLTVPLDTSSTIAAMQVCRHYCFDELQMILDEYLRDGGMDPAKCTKIFAAALSASRAHQPDTVNVVRSASWKLMKENFADVRDWSLLPFNYMARLLKLNDIRVKSEAQVFEAVEEWVRGNVQNRDNETVTSLVKLVRFPTMSEEELRDIEKRPLFNEYPLCVRYVRRGLSAKASEKRGVVRDEILEASPVYRRRRMDALTFSDRVASWSSISNTVHTSARYFAGCLWNLVVDPTDEGVGLYLGCLSEESQGSVDVEFDFAIFFVKHQLGENDAPQLIRKQAKDVRFTRSGQRVGFANLVSSHDLTNDEANIVRDDTLFIGASIRLRTCTAPVAGIDVHGDDTAEMRAF